MILQQHKIVFAGSMGAGKSTAIQTISNIDVLTTEAINTDLQAHQKTLTTVGIDYGELTLEDGIVVGLYGTPGQERFNFIWNVITQGSIGTILFIDHSSNDPIQQLEYYLDYFKEKSSNIVIGVTHVDQKSTHNTSIYQEWLNTLDTSLAIFFIDARNKEDVLLLIDTLITQTEVILELN